MAYFSVLCSVTQLARGLFTKYRPALVWHQGHFPSSHGQPVWKRWPLNMGTEIKTRHSASLTPHRSSMCWDLSCKNFACCSRDRLLHNSWYLIFNCFFAIFLYFLYTWFSDCATLFRLFINLWDFLSCVLQPPPTCSGLVSRPLLRRTPKISPAPQDIVAGLYFPSHNP